MQNQLTADKEKEFSLDRYGFLKGLPKKEKYVQYQSEYREQYGVFPEFDQIHRPFFAIMSEVDDMYLDIVKTRPIWIFGEYIDKHFSFKKKFKKVYFKYGREFSFISLVGIIPLLEDIKNKGITCNIQNNLGYRKESNGNYFEGTWENGRLVDGLMYDAEKEILCIGSFSPNHDQYFDGICTKIENSKIEIMYCGNFRYNNGLIQPHSKNVLSIIGNEEKNVYSVGEYEYGYPQGKFIAKLKGDSDSFATSKYDQGEEVPPSGLLKVLGTGARIYWSLILLVLFIPLFLYWLAGYIFGYPIHRGIASSNKKKRAKLYYSKHNKK